MGFWSDFGKGISYHVKAFQFIAKHGLWVYFLYPILLVALIGFFGIISISGISDRFTDHVMYMVGGSSLHGGWIDHFYGILHFIIGLILKVILFFVFSSLLKYIVLILCSPIMALLSERVEEIKSGKKFPFRFPQFLHDMFRGIAVSFRNMFLEYGILLLCLIIGWIPIIGWIIVPFIYVIGWYFLGFNMMDYSYERRRMKISDGAKFTRKHKGIAIGNGLVFSLLLMIPLLGIALAPILSVTAATLATMDEMDKKLF